MRTYLNFLIVFTLSGMWHGSGWAFIIWGLMHGILYVITRAVKRKKASRSTKSSEQDNTEKSPALRKKGVIPEPAAVFLTFMFFAFSMVFFRAGDIRLAFEMLVDLFSPSAFISRRILSKASRSMSCGISSR
jgi:D-alanyl-lipoteichoic acid acyltransferase DltB (MBOAT superfamily)